MFNSKLKGQHLSEYALIFSIILAALLALQVYVKRGLQAGYKDATDTIAGVLGQYEPYYAESKVATAVQENKTETVNLGGSAGTLLDRTAAIRAESKSYQRTLPAESEE